MPQFVQARSAEYEAYYKYKYAVMHMHENTTTLGKTSTLQQTGNRRQAQKSGRQTLPSEGNTNALASAVTSAHIPPGSHID